MNTYRVTFYTNSEIHYKTVLKAISLDDVETIVMEKVKSDSGTFEVEGKHNRFFKVHPSGYTFIEYELLFAGSVLTFDEISSFNVDARQQIINETRNNDVLALALNELSEESLIPFLSVMSKDKLNEVKEAMSNLWEPSISEVMEARKIIVDIALRLIKSDKIKFSKNK